MTWRVDHGDCIDVMAAMTAASIDAVVTDPPYGLEFMGSEWDRFRPAAARLRTKVDQRTNGVAKATVTTPESYVAGQPFQAWCEAWAREALRVLKPGGYLLAFGGTRTYHRLVAGIEDAGFEIRDQLAWIFGSGFPKSHNIGGGLGTALKPAHEPIVLARKPLSGTVVATVAEHGTGALNIDACRINPGDPVRGGGNGKASVGGIMGPKSGERALVEPHDAGRWPANVLLDQAAADQLDEQSGVLVSGANPIRRGGDKFRDVYGDFKGQEECEAARGVDVGGASRFFYCAKASSAERDAGLDGLPAAAVRVTQTPTSTIANGRSGSARVHDREFVPAPRANTHPTVKPIEVMRWLVRLITPEGGIVLDPFAGSGTTGIAALREQRSFIGIEREAEYHAIARARIIGDAPLLNAGAEAVA